MIGSGKKEKIDPYLVPGEQDCEMLQPPVDRNLVRGCFLRAPARLKAPNKS